MSLSVYVRPLQVTSDSYEPIRSSVNGSGFRPFDMVIPFSFRKGEITGETQTQKIFNMLELKRKIKLQTYK